MCFAVPNNKDFQYLELAMWLVVITEENKLEDFFDNAKELGEKLELRVENLLKNEGTYRCCL